MSTHSACGGGDGCDDCEVVGWERGYAAGKEERDRLALAVNAEIAQVARLRVQHDALAAERDRLRDALEECGKIFTDIWGHWTEPRSWCRKGWRIITVAISAPGDQEEGEEHMDKSRRQRLRELAETGRLRDLLSDATPRVEEEVADLIVDLCIRYCESKKSTTRAALASPEERP